MKARVPLGSCSRRGGRNIHWATMQLSTSLVDYVLVHELAHLHYHDRSAEFWRMVERTMPDFDQRVIDCAVLEPDCGCRSWRR
ncbi:MAG: M48 metallopeptidase family protein [Pseudonocardiaceae bacterium]